ncbi:MAG: hypothetical protein F4X92_00355 [Gammaproteobacteria bacterium]|nr:hypothetical protein [Gammaproteobacteria bacterium]
MIAGDSNSGAAIMRIVKKIFVLFPRLEERLRRIFGTLSGDKYQMLVIAKTFCMDQNNSALGLAYPGIDAPHG